MDEPPPALTAVWDDDVGVVASLMRDRNAGLDLWEIVDLGPLDAEPDAAAKHEVVEEQFEVFDLFDVGEEAVVQRGAVELLHKRGAELPEGTPRKAGTKVEHVIEQRFSFLLAKVCADFDCPVDAPLNSLWPCFSIA